MVAYKTAVVTGGTRGIGKAIVALFLNQGFKVITCSRNPQKVDELKQQFATHVKAGMLLALQVDMSIKTAVLDFASQITDNTRQVNVLVNNAGIFLPGSIMAEEEHTFETLINTNLASAYHLTRALMPHIPQHQGAHIFNMCSTASITPYINGGSYCISKFALLGFSKVLREELKQHGIKVTAILPGPTLTDSWAGANLPDTRFMTAKDIADTLWAAYSLSPAADIEEILMRPLPGDI